MRQRDVLLGVLVAALAAGGALVGCATTADTSANASSSASEDGSGEDGSVLDPGAAQAPARDPEAAMLEVRAAHQALREGDPEAALAAAERALALDPDSALAHLAWANAGEQTEKDPAAVRGHLDAAVALAPENPRAHHARALFFESQGMFEAAMREYAEATALREDFVDAHLRLAHNHLRRGELDDATSRYERALRGEPTNTSALIGLADACEARKDLACAENALRALVKSHPQVSVHRQRLIRFYKRTGQPQKASAEQRRLDKRDPDDTRRLRPLRRSRR